MTCVKKRFLIKFLLLFCCLLFFGVVFSWCLSKIRIRSKNISTRFRDFFSRSSQDFQDLSEREKSKIRGRKGLLCIFYLSWDLTSLVFCQQISTQPPLWLHSNTLTNTDAHNKPKSHLTHTNTGFPHPCSENPNSLFQTYFENKGLRSRFLQGTRSEI